MKVTIIEDFKDDITICGNILKTFIYKDTYLEPEKVCELNEKIDILTDIVEGLIDGLLERDVLSERQATAILNNAARSFHVKVKK